jgi:ribosomal protein L2
VGPTLVPQNADIGAEVELGSRRANHAELATVRLGKIPTGGPLMPVEGGIGARGEELVLTGGVHTEVTAAMEWEWAAVRLR